MFFFRNSKNRDLVSIQWLSISRIWNSWNPRKRNGTDLELRSSDSLPRLLFRPTTVKIKGLVKIIEICFTIAENIESKDHRIRGFAHCSDHKDLE